MLGLNLSLKDLFKAPKTKGLGGNTEPLEKMDFKPIGRQKEIASWAFDFQAQKPVKVLLGARGYGKTETVLFYALIEQFKKSPTTTVILITRHEDRCKEIIESLGIRLKSLGFTGDFKKKAIRLSVNRSQKNPSLKGLTINSSSFKGNHVDFVIMDDPLDPADEFSPTYQKRALKVFYEVGNIAKKGVLVIGQPVCEGDIYEMLRTNPTTDLFECWHGQIPALDKNLAKLERSGVPLREIQKNFFGVLTKGDSYPFYSYIQTLDLTFDRAASLTAFLDPSFTGGDYCALSIGFFFERFLVVKGFLFKKSWSLCLDRIETILEQHGVKKAFYESNGVGDAIYLASDGFLTPYKTPMVKKEARIAQLERLFYLGLIKFSIDCDDLYLSQIKNWSPILKNPYDDAPDSLASLVKVMGIF